MLLRTLRLATAAPSANGPGSPHRKEILLPLRRFRQGDRCDSALARWSDRLCSSERKTG